MPREARRKSKSKIYRIMHYNKRVNQINIFKNDEEHEKFIDVLDENYV